jgi:hypothetical protein
MIALYRKLFDLLDARERRRFLLLLGLIVLMGLVDMVGVAAVLPFLAVLADPAAATAHPLLGRLHAALGLPDERSFLVLLAGLVLGLLLVSLAVRSATLYAIARFSHMRNYSLSSRLLGGYLRQPYVWFLDRHSADLGKSVLSEVDRVVGEALVPAMRIIAQTVTLTCLLALLLLVDPAVTAAAALGFGLTYGLIFLGVRRFLARIAIRRRAANAERYHIAQEAMGGIKDVKLLGLEATYLARYRVPSRRRGGHCERRPGGGRAAARAARDAGLRRHDRARARPAAARRGRSCRGRADARGLCLRRAAHPAGGPADLSFPDPDALCRPDARQRAPRHGRDRGEPAAAGPRAGRAAAVARPAPAGRHPLRLSQGRAGRACRPLARDRGQHHRGPGGRHGRRQDHGRRPHPRPARPRRRHHHGGRPPVTPDSHPRLAATRSATCRSRSTCTDASVAANIAFGLPRRRATWPRWSGPRAPPSCTISS